MDAIRTVLNYFHRDSRYNRTTFGLDQIKGGARLIHWRVTDLALLGAFLILYHVVYNIEPFQRQFYIGDLTISHPFAEHERVNNTELFLYAVWFPLVAIGIVSLIMTKPANKIYVTYVALLGQALSVLTASIVTDILKNAFGRHRPDFLARCVPKSDAPLDVLVYAKDVCTTKNLPRLLDGFRTTPLGHSSISFAGLLYLLFFLAGQLTVTRPQAGAWRSIVVLVPTLGAALIALSRTEDYRHHFIDVFVGSCLGVVVAVWSYFRLFPGLSDFKCYEPRLLQYEEKTDEPDYQPVADV